MSSVSTSSTVFSSSDVMATGTSGVAALDTPQLTQTKLEIRNLVSQIAQLSSRDIPQAEFVTAVLPRICTAMGASAAALWQRTGADQLELLGHFHLPMVLDPAHSPQDHATESTDHSAHHPANSACSSHQQILACVAVEGTAVLVPPKSIRITAERPTNPLDECLLIVPIKIDDQCEVLLEVIQPPSGGPAAQRGYLRFVAQMADLVADFMRKLRLRQLASQSAYVQALQTNLLAISAAADQTIRLQKTAGALSRLLEADLTIIACRKRILGWPFAWRVRAVSDVPTFDSRSEIVLLAERYLQGCTQVPASESRRFSLVASEQLTTDEAANDTTAEVTAETAAATIDDSPTDSAPLNQQQRLSQQLRKQLGCSHLARLSLDTHGQTVALVALGSACQLTEISRRAEELSVGLEVLIQPAARPHSLGRPALGWFGRQAADSATIAQRTAARARWTGWGMRLGTAMLLTAVVLFPVSDNISAVAVLESVDKEHYYAPGSATVATVLVDTHETVKKGQPLLRLVDPALESRYAELLAQNSTTRIQLEQDQIQLKKGNLADSDAIQLSHRIEQHKIAVQAIERQLAILKAQVDGLEIVARRDARVTSWDVRNQLSGRPVAAGQILLSTVGPNSPSQLRLSIPERQLGRLREVMAGSREGLPVQFSLSSHPSDVRQGRLVSLSDQLIKDDDGTAKAIGIVAVDAHSLPAKSDGTIARATVTCGRTCVGWLAVRDAYREANAWWKLNW